MEVNSINDPVILTVGHTWKINLILKLAEKNTCFPDIYSIPELHKQTPKIKFSISTLNEAIKYVNEAVIIAA